jgi:sphingolipid delta-4 desaturase
MTATVTLTELRPRGALSRVLTGRKGPPDAEATKGLSTANNFGNASIKTLDAHDKTQWKQEKPKDFTWSEDKEPHAIRRKEILSKYPQIKQLMRPDPLSAVFCTCTILIQFLMAWAVSESSWWAVIFWAYSVGGFLNHSLLLAMHELSHDLWFPKRWMNTAMGFFANLPSCVASSGTFKRYHLEHHSFQGSDKYDADIPTPFEAWLFRTSLGKAIWVFCQPLFYGLRPVLMKPKPISKIEIVNWIVVGAFDFAVIKFWGAKAFVYLLAGSLLGMGWHPMAGHFVAEHFEFIEGQETYSYYGPLNYLAYNVGYHNEHHDFPKVPGRLLPLITEIAPEYYDNLPYYDSWTKVLLGFVFNHSINQFCRVKRKP